MLDNNLLSEVKQNYISLNKPLFELHVFTSLLIKSTTNHLPSVKTGPVDAVHISIITTYVIELITSISNGPSF